ncbi:alanine racemase C-terminal domain-containing protein, partial [Thermodesulfobacteriota bacterium]
GKKADITGSVCMNMLACDVTGINDLKPGDECVIMGSQGDETITVDDIAEWCDTISYEILLSIGRASEKKYIS